MLLPGRSTIVAAVSVSFRIKTRYFKQISVRFISTMTDKAEKKPFERLPTNVVPKNYALILTPNLKDFTFVGEEVVQLEVKIFM
jgi:hypothetical protein